MNSRAAILLTVLLAASRAPAQNDSVDVTFFYTPAGHPSRVYLPGEFNNWANNTNGFINPDPRWNMDQDSAGTWHKTVRLRVGGHIGGRVAGAYQYKFNEDGSNTGWLADPLNPRTNPSDNGNSVLYLRNPAIHYLLPFPGSGVKTDAPAVTAYIFPAAGQRVDTSASTLLLDGASIGSIGARYDSAAKKLFFPLPHLADGEHRVLLSAVSSGGSVSADSTRFFVQAGVVQILTRSNDDVRIGTKTVKGILLDSSVASVRVRINDTAYVATVPAAQGAFSADLSLLEGTNVVTAEIDRGGSTSVSRPITLVYKKEHAPKSVIMFGAPGATVSMNAFASTDPDGDSLAFTWRSEDSLNPLPLHLLASGPVATIAKPAAPGEYYVSLEAADPANNRSVARNYFTVNPDSSLAFGTLQTNPAWVRDAVIYEIFVPAFSAAGTLDAVTSRLSSLRDLGVNTLWLMPIMDNNGTINDMNGGYDIVDFFSVEPQLGDLASFRRLADSCHAGGMRVILDITPNHVSQKHPWVEDIRQWGEYSNFRSFIETRILGDNRGLGQSVSLYNGQPLYAHYDGWGLANLNLSDAECRLRMMDVFRFWLLDQRADGYRMDVYWGPQNRYGAAAFWAPVREELKRRKPEALILGETDGTGIGSEVNFADRGGACDAAYDWNLFGQIKDVLRTSNVNALHDRVTNYSPTAAYNYYTGPDARYFRFLENHDETRIAQEFSADPERTRAGAALLLSIPGIPMIYAGQEVGWTGRRDRIDFSGPAAAQFYPAYKRYIRLRSMFPAFRTDNLVRLSSSSSGVYAYLRPFKDQNIAVAINFTPNPVTAEIRIPQSELALSHPPVPGKSLYLNDLVNDTSLAATAEDPIRFRVALGAWQCASLLLADTLYRVVITGAEPERTAAATSFDAAQNYPNPWSRETTIPLPVSASRIAEARLLLYDRLGRLVADLTERMRHEGGSVTISRGDLSSPGLYYYVWILPDGIRSRAFQLLPG